MVGLGQEVIISILLFTSGNQESLTKKMISTALKGNSNKLNVCYTASAYNETYNRPLYCLPAIGNELWKEI